MKYLFAIMSITLTLFITGCNSINNKETLGASISEQKIQQLEQNDRYIPWWKQ